MRFLAVAVAALAAAAPAYALADFRTPGKAAYCGVSHGEPPHALICWTPNDGFTVTMTARGRPTKRYVSANRGLYDFVGRVLGYGGRWSASPGFRCTSRRSGLTCVNRGGHGWWLGRFRGYRLF